MEISRENIDEVLFEYFEGNLSEQDKAVVKKFIDNHPDYLEDFRMWEVSNGKNYLLEEVAVDKSLLKTSSVLFVRKIIGITISIVLVGSFLWWTQTEKSRNTFSVVIDSSRSEVKAKENIHFDAQKQEKSLFKKKRLEVSADKFSEVQDTSFVQVLSVNTSAEIVHDSILLEGTNKKQEDIKASDLIKETCNVDNSIVKKELSRREERKKAVAMRKHKQKLKDKREQEEFLKGNKPYVVPLNPTNF